MQYIVKRGRSYINPTTGGVTIGGEEVVNQEIDKTQLWKLETPGTLVQKPVPMPVVKKQTFDEHTQALVEHRDKVTEKRRQLHSQHDTLAVTEAKVEAAKVKSDSVKKQKQIVPDDYDEMDEGEET